MLLAQTHQASPTCHQLLQQQQTSSQPRRLRHNRLYQLESHPYLAGGDIDLDQDLVSENDRFSSSPISTRPLLSEQYSSAQAPPPAAFDDVATVAIPREANHAEYTNPLAAYLPALCDSESSFIADNDPMHADSWLPNAQLTPKSATALSHNRDSSLSSLGSTGPASPYSQNTSNPRIAVTDPIDDFHGISSADDLQYQLVKSFPHDSFYAHYPNYANVHGAANSNVAVARRPRNERSLLAQSELTPTGQNKSRPVSVASSIVSNSPATPAGDLDEDIRQRSGFNSMPKLDRTMTDVYNDELYNPNFNITSASPGQIPVSPNNGLFAQRVRAANSQHLSTAHSPVSTSSRDKSPFRHGSPLAPLPSHDFPAVSSGHMGFGSAQQMREQRKAEQDVQVVQQQLAHRSDTGTPQTISPKDAVLEFHSPEGDTNFPLFPQQESNGFEAASQLKNLSQTPQSFSGLQLDGNAFGNYAPSQFPANIQLPQHYPFIAQQPRQQNIGTTMNQSSVVPSRLGSTESGPSEPVHSDSSQRPSGASAGGGTYTCTYHGCTLRFETPALLQKHKREGHRQGHGLSGQRRTDGAGAGTGSGMTSSLLNSQAGPHRCDRLNPSTGKPCNTVFSRPYDLTRHEDTIHNARKQKVRCNLCTDEKTFSRADALTRHYRVCHPDVEFAGRHRRRG